MKKEYNIFILIEKILNTLNNSRLEYIKAADKSPYPEYKRFLNKTATTRNRLCQDLMVVFRLYYNAPENLVLNRKRFSTAVGDEGGFAPEINSPEEALSLISEAILSSGYKVEDEITFTGGSGDAKIQITGVQEQTEWEERDNFLPIPPQVLGVNRVFGVKGSNIRSNLFGLEYQLFLNDLYQFGSVDILSYFMTKTYLETLDMVLNNGAFIPYRFNRRADRLYIDTDRLMLDEGSYLIIDCHRLLDPQTYTEVYNDPFLKKYTTALIKRQWGQNLIKFKGAQLPGGITMNGRELYDDGNSEVMKIEDEITSTYELPPNWEIG